jgi:hypothetical protein
MYGAMSSIGLNFFKGLSKYFISGQVFKSLPTRYLPEFFGGFGYEIPYFCLPKTENSSLAQLVSVPEASGLIRGGKEEKNRKEHSSLAQLVRASDC